MVGLKSIGPGPEDRAVSLSTSSLSTQEALPEGRVVEIEGGAQEQIR